MTCRIQRARLLLSGICLSASVALAAEQVAPDLVGAAYESGSDVGPLRKLEQQMRAAVGDPGQRAECETALLRLLVPEATFEAKRFACSSLAVFGSEVSLPALALLLKQDETVGIACLALGGLKSAKAGDLLRDALTDTRGAARLQIVSALGYRGEDASVKPLAELSGDADTVIACAAIRALGLIGTRAARDRVAALRREARPALAAAVAAAALSGAEQSAASGDRAAASAVCEELLTSASPAHVRRGSLNLLLRSDADQGLQRVLNVLSATPLDPVLAAVAIARVPELRGEGISKTFGDLLPRLPPAEQELLVEALACRADPQARAVLRAQIGAADPAVRRAAIGAVGTLEGSSAVGALTKALAAAPTPDEAKVAQAALSGLSGGEATDRAIIAEVRQAAGKDKLPLMAVLSARGGRLPVVELLEQASASDEAVARAALQALARVASNGDGNALAVVQAAVAGGDARSREIALRTLAAWRGVAAWDTLAGIYLAQGEESQRALALRGLVRSASEANASPDAALIGRYRQLLAGARGAEERKLILRVLGGARHPEALALALPLLAEAGVRPEAEEAVVRLANALAATHPEQSRDALRRVKEGKPAP